MLAASCGARVMSHSEALSRLTIENRRSDMSRWARRRGIDNLLASAALIGGLGLSAPAVAQVSDRPPTVTVYSVTPERIAASTAAVVGLIGAIIGGLALARSGRTGAGNGRRSATMALAMGPIALLTGGLVVATADGGVGTGNGIAGGVVAMMVGLIGMALGGLALARSRRTA
jgi:hypothetical protein